MSVYKNYEGKHPEEISIKKIFKDSKYIVPIYQRNYSWTSVEIEQLLDDINSLEYCELNKSYYLGSLIVDEKEMQVDNAIRNYEVIDGQQRLTTIYLLLNYFKMLNGKNVFCDFNLNENCLIFEARDKSNYTINNLEYIVEKTFKNGILNLDEINEVNEVNEANEVNEINEVNKINEVNEANEVDEIDEIDEIDEVDEIDKTDEVYENHISKEIIEGYSIIDNYFKGENADLKHFLEKLDRVKLIRIQVPKGTDLNNYFEVMNTRSEQLEAHEIVKAVIIGAIGGKNKKLDRIIAGDVWDSCSKMNKYIQMSFPSEIRKKIFGECLNSFQIKNFSELRDSLKNFYADRISEKEEHNNEKSTSKRKSLYDILGHIRDKSDEVLEKGKLDIFNDSVESNYKSIISFPNFLLQVNSLIKIDEKICEKDLKLEEIHLELEKISLDDKKLIKIITDGVNSAEDDEKSELALNFIFSMLKYRYLFDCFVIKRDESELNENVDRWSLKSLEEANGEKTYKNTFSSDNSSEITNNRIIMLQSCLRTTYTSPRTMSWIAECLINVNEILYGPKSKYERTSENTYSDEILNGNEMCDKTCEKSKYEKTSESNALDEILDKKIIYNETCEKEVSEIKSTDETKFEDMVNDRINDYDLGVEISNRINNCLEKYCCRKIKDFKENETEGFSIDRIVFTYLDYIIWKKYIKYNRNKSIIANGNKDFSNKGENTNRKEENANRKEENTNRRNGELYSEINEAFNNSDVRDGLNKFTFQYRTSIEHFFPRNYCKKDEINGFNGVSSKEIDSIGNLALITVSANSLLLNNSPVDKISVDKMLVKRNKRSIINQSPKMMIMASMTNKNGVWNDGMVRKHKEDMMNLIEEEIVKKI